MSRKKSRGACISVLLILVMVVSTILAGCASEEEPVPNPEPTQAPVPAFATSDELTTLEGTVKALANELDDTKDDVRSNASKIDNLQDDVDSLPSASNSVPKAEFANFSTETASDISGIKADIAVLKAALADLNDQLEEGDSGGSGNSDVDPEDAVELEVRYFPLYSVKAGTTSISIPIRIRAENVLAVDIEEVELGIEVRVSDDDLDFDKITMSGGGITWSGYGSGGTWSFVNWTDVDFDAGERKTFDPILKITLGVAALADTDLTVNIDAYCDDYRLKD